MTTCDACGKVLDIAVVLDITEQLAHDEATTEITNLFLSRQWCQPCGWRLADIVAKALHNACDHAGLRQEQQQQVGHA